MEDARVERITGYAGLSDARKEVDEAARRAAAGDVDWQAWIDDWRAGAALVLRLELTAEVCARDGPAVRVRSCGPVWVERHGDPPRVEEQLRQLAGNDFGELAGALRAHGLEIDESDLDDMYVEIRLDRSLRDALAARAVTECPVGPGDRAPDA